MSVRNAVGRVALLGALALFGASCSGSDNAADQNDGAVPDAEISDGAAAEIEANAEAEIDVNASTDEETPDELASEGSDNTPEPADLAGVEQLWVDNGTSPELASCYRGVLEGAGVEEVADLNELTEIMSNLDDAGQQAINDCVAS